MRGQGSDGDAPRGSRALAPPGVADAGVDLLWESARIAPRPERVTAAIGAGADPRAVADHALRNGTTSLLWRALVAAECTDWLGPMAGEVTAEVTLRRHEALLLIPHALAMSAGTLADAGLEPLAFKGPTLAARYPEPGLRSMVDIDLLLPREAHDRAVGVLRHAGWQVLQHSGTSSYDSVFSHADVPGLTVELHHGLDLWYQRSTSVRLESLWGCRRASECMGTPVFVLPPEAEIPALAAHAGKPFHCFGRLIWSVDIAIAIAVSGGVDWDRVRRLAASWRCRTVLAIALTQAARLGADVPSDLTQLHTTMWRRGIAPVLDPGWVAVRADSGTRNRLRYALADDWHRRAILLAGLPAPAPIREWPARYAEVLSNAARRTWQTVHGRRPEPR